MDVKPKALTDLQIYNLRLTELKNNAKAAKEALQFPAEKADISALGDAFDSATEALNNFLKSAEKIPSRIGNLKEITGAKSPFKFGSYKPGEAKTTVNAETGLFNVDKTEVPGLDMTGIAASIKGGEELKAKLDEEFITPFEQFTIDLNSLIEQGMNDAIGTFAEGIGQLIAGDITPQDFGNKILGMIGSFMTQMGTLFIAYAIASKGFAAAIGLGPANPMSWGLAMAAGVGLIVAGSAISSLSKKGMSNSSGSGGYASASGYSASSGGSNISNMLQGNVVFELQGTTLKGVLNNTDRKNKSIR
jgi:hypothetical protein